MIRHVAHAAGVPGIEQHGVVERVVEDGVGDQATGIVCFAVRVEAERVARAAANGVIVDGCSLQLIHIQRLDVATVVLVELCEAVVEEDGGGHLFGDLEFDGALADGPADGRREVIWVPDVGDLLGPPCWLVGGAFAEGVCHFV